MHGKYDEVVRSISQLKGVRRAFPVLGRYDVVVDLEAEDSKEIGSTIMRMGRIFGVVFTESLMEIEH
jgi:DNA-binding Lrp family transcriptional regulator